MAATDEIEMTDSQKRDVLRSLVMSGSHAAEDLDMADDVATVDTHREHLSRLMRALAREAPHQPDPARVGPFCPLARTVVYLTIRDDEFQLDTSQSQGRREMFEDFFLNQAAQTDNTALEESSDFKNAKKHTGVSPDVLVTRIEQLQKEFRLRDAMSGEVLRRLATQMSGRPDRLSGQVITYQMMLDFITVVSPLDRAAHTEAQRNERQRMLAKIRRKFDISTNKEFDAIMDREDDGKLVVDADKFHGWLRTQLKWDFTELEVDELLFDIRKAGSKASNVGRGDVDHDLFTSFLLTSARRRSQPGAELDIIVDIQVGGREAQPEGYQGVAVHHHGMRPDATDLSTSSFTSKEIYIWFLTSRGLQSPTGTCRLTPIVDVRIEANNTSSDMVAAGYCCCAVNLDNSMVTKTSTQPVNRGRYLWFRRAISSTEARDHALTGLAFTAGRMSDIKDRMHNPPDGDDVWHEVFGRQQRSMPLKRRRLRDMLGRTEDLKLWCQRRSHANLEDRVSLCLHQWSSMKKSRELELAVRRGLRQRHRTSRSNSLAGPPDFTTAFLDHLPRGYTKLTRAAWLALLHSAGLCVDQRDSDLLMNRVSHRDDSCERMHQEDFIAFVSKTEFELEEAAFHLKQELRRRQLISGTDPKLKKHQLKRLRTRLLLACTADRDGRSNLSMAHFGYLLQCIDEFLTDGEQIRLIQRFDPDFRGSVSVDRLLYFVASERDAPRERAERVVLAAQALCEFVQECALPAAGSLWPFGATRGDAGGDEVGGAVTDAWSKLAAAHQQRYRPLRRFPGILPARAAEVFRLEPEDLALAVERRRGQQLGVRGAIRLSPYEARQLVMLIAPESNEGDVSQLEFRDFFDLRSGRRAHIHLQPRPLGELLELLGTPTRAHPNPMLGEVLQCYKEWYDSEDPGTPGSRGHYESVRDDRIQELFKDIFPDALLARTRDLRIDLKDFAKPFFHSGERGNGLQPSEVALLALFTGADEISDEGVAAMADGVDEGGAGRAAGRAARVRYNIKARVFFDGVCRLIYGDIEPRLEERAAAQRPTGSDSHMATVCADLVREIEDRCPLDGEEDYDAWLRAALSEFRIGTESELQSWCAGAAPIGVPLDAFRRLLVAYDRAFGWELERDVLRAWALDWDVDQDQRIRPKEVKAFMDGTSKASYTTTKKPSQPEGGGGVRFTLGDKFAEELVLKIVSVLSAEHIFSQGIAILQRAFDHPLVDPYPQTGAVAFHPFRRAMASAGVPIDYGEDEAGLNFFKDSNDQLIDYSHFIQCVKRAWLASNAQRNSGAITGSLELDAKLSTLREELRRYVATVGESDRFAPSKIFHKMDTNRDGRLSAAEFLSGVRTLKLRCDLSEAELQSIFDFFDDDHDGTIDYEEFYHFCLQGTVGNLLRRKDIRALQYDSDSDTGSIENELNTPLKLMAEADHIRAARNAVNRRWPSDANREKLRAYLRQKDLNNDGTVSEKVFLRFLKRAQISQHLSRRQLQALVQSLDERASHWIKYPVFIRECIDRPERLAKAKADKPGDKMPMKKAPVPQRDSTPLLQHIVEAATTAQRSRGVHLHSMFVAHDASGSHGVAKDVAIRVLRSIGCEMTDAEFHVVFDLLPARSDGFLDYVELSALLQQTPPPGAWRLAGPGMTTSPLAFNPIPNPGVSVIAPTTPFTPHPARGAGLAHTVSFAGHTPSWVTQPVGGGDLHMTGAGVVSSLALSDLATRVMRATQTEATKWSGHFSLRLLFERAYDRGMQGVVSLSDFQLALNQHLNLVLSAADIAAVRRSFERVLGPGFAGVDYIEFCRFVEAEGASLSRLAERVAAGLAEQRRRGLNLGLTFEMHDAGNTGLVPLGAFQDAMRQLGTSLSDSQTRTVAARFMHPTSPGLVDYREFLSFVSRVSPSADLSASFERPSVTMMTGGDRGSFDEGDLPPVAPTLSRGRNNDFVDFPRRERPPSLDGPLLLEHDRSVNWHAVDTLTPRVHADRQLPGSPGSPMRAAHPMSSRAVTRHHDSYYGAPGSAPRSPVRDQQRDNALRVWGAQTPIGSRGEVPQQTQRRLDEQGKWMCVTCLFSENSGTSNKCEVCCAVNPRGRSAQVLQECLNCHFTNLEHATTCSMCGKTLFPASGTSRTPVPALPPSDGTGWRSQRRGSRDLSDDEGFGFRD